MERKVFERRIIGSLIVLLIIEMTLLGLHLGWGGFIPPAPRRDAVVAGHVVKSENELRRRGSGSLVWEKSASDDSLYYYDSVLTLSQSTASLKLSKDTEVNLSENTLVTIEPQETAESGEIRLRFTRGNVQARNPFAPARMSSETWFMDIKVGSDVDLRQVGADQFEVGVKKGEVGFVSKQGKEKVSADQVLRISKDGTERLEMDDSFSWVDLPASRLYTHDETVNFDLKWTSPAAKELLIQTIGGQESRLQLAEGETHQTVTLPLGHHLLFLRAGNKTSQALNVEVWKAPILHLLAPLPRNRVKTGEPTQFVWMMAPGISRFDLSLKGQKHLAKESGTENTFSATFNDEDDLEWSVEGRDKDGFVIPPLYSYPLFIRETPLEAPKLMPPTLRRPAEDEPDRGASLWSWILPQAFADQVYYQAIFHWQPVAGADHYVLEVAESADFRNPILIKVLPNPEFVWKKMPLKTYFWRVAAEAKSGRLGIFSEPQEVDLNAGGEGVQVAPLKQARKKPAPKPIAEAEPPPPPPAEPVTPAPTPPPAPPAAVAEPQDKIAIHPHDFFEWRPMFTNIDQTNSDGLHSVLQGRSMFSVSVGTDRQLSSDSFLKMEIDYTQRKFQADPQSKYPLQNDLSWSDVDLFLLQHKTSSRWALGLYALHSALLVRDTLESVRVKNTYDVGGCVETVYDFGPIHYIGDHMAVVGTEYGLVTRQTLRVYPVDQFYLGGGIEGGMLFHTGGQTLSVSGQLSVGLEF